MAMSLTDLQDIQRQRNLDTQGNWERSQAHREQITAKLLERDSESLLRVFGAGNSNDLDLKQLSRHYTQIELVDIDSEALAYGFQSQGISDKDGVELLAGVDLSRHKFQPTRPASTTVSACLFTQLIEQQTVEHNRNPEEVARFRENHLKMLIESTQPAGRVFFITDIVSDYTARQLPYVSSDQLNGFLSELVASNNFFTGTNPFAIQKQLDSFVQVESHHLHDAWIWQLGARRFAVYAIEIQIVA